MKVSIIIPTYNRKDTLKKTLERLYKSTILPDEVIIIDQSKELFNLNVLDNNLLKDIDIKLIHLTNPSSTKARNIGINCAKNEIIIFMDDDLYVDNFTIEKTLKNFKENKNIALVDAIHYEENSLYNKDINSKFKINKVISYLFARKKLSNNQGYFCKFSMLGRYNLHNKSNKTEWAMGYYFAVKKEIIDKYNIRFDENLTSYAYGEDLDFTFRYCSKLKDLGLLSIIDQSIYVNHIAAQEYREPTKKTLNIYVVNRWYLSYKHFSSSIYRVGLIWSDIFEFIRRFVLKQYPLELVKTHIKCFRNRKSIKLGTLENLY